MCSQRKRSPAKVEGVTEQRMLWTIIITSQRGSLIGLDSFRFRKSAPPKKHFALGNIKEPCENKQNGVTDLLIHIFFVTVQASTRELQVKGGSINILQGLKSLKSKRSRCIQGTQATTNTFCFCSFHMHCSSVSLGCFIQVLYQWHPRSSGFCFTSLKPIPWRQKTLWAWALRQVTRSPVPSTPHDCAFPLTRGR